MHALKTGFATFRFFRKGFITHSFCKLPLSTLEAAEHKYTCAISKHMKTYE